MAFWKHFGKKSSSFEKPSRTKIKDEGKNHKMNSSIPVSLPPSGDLGESLINLMQSPESKISLEKDSSKQHTVSSTVDVGDLGDFSSPESVRPRLRRSRLSKNLHEILADLSALAFFQQFLESKQASTYLTLLNDIKNYHLLANSAINNPLLNEDGLTDLKCSPTTNDFKLHRLLNSNSSSSGFSDDTSLDSPSAQRSNRFKCLETETMTHSVLSEQRRIAQKYFDPESSDYLSSVAHLCKEMGETVDSDDPFHEVQTGVWQLLENDFFPEYLHSEFHYKYQLDIIASGKLSISDVLYNDTLLFYFMEFMDQITKRHWLEFWLSVDNYRLQWTALNASADALIIYNKYFSLQASQPLGLSDTIRSTIEENICAPGGPGPECFEYSLNYLLTSMEKKCLQPFLMSQVFNQFLTEIVSALKHSNPPQRSGSNSTINSEFSVMSSNTSNTTNNLLPTTSLAIPNLTNSSAENAMIRVINNIRNESLVIDIRQLNDPDHLWKRNNTKLSFGRLTPMGRFHRETEIFFDNKTGSKLSKVVKKFVLKEEEEEKIEVAWHEAEMIVGDILAITLMKQNVGDATSVTEIEFSEEPDEYEISSLNF